MNSTPDAFPTAGNVNVTVLLTESMAAMAVPAAMPVPVIACPTASRPETLEVCAIVVLPLVASPVKVPAFDEPGRMSRVYVGLAVLLPLSVTVSVTEYVPAVVGVPEITPAGEQVSPVGSPTAE